MGKGDEHRARAREALHATQTELTEHVHDRFLRQDLERQHLQLQRLQAKLTAAKAEADAQRHRYSELFDFSPIGYLSLDGTGIIQSINLIAARLLGAERSRLVGAPLLTRVSPSDRRRVLDHLRRCRSSFGLVTLDLELPTAGRGTTPAQLITKRGAIAPEGGAFLCALVDMTEREEALAERRRIDLERERAERAGEVARAESAAKDRFLAVLSHELRNPLSPILYTVETLERGLLPRERMPAALALIRRNLDLEVRLIDDLLDVSRIVHGKLTLERHVIDMHDVIRDAADGATKDVQRGDLSLTLELAATRHRVSGDPARLRQVVWNLLSNAIRNTPPHGCILVSTRDIDDAIALIVRDSGRGVAADRLETIFQPFDQVDPPGRRRGGLGLGLAICRGLVEAHGGRVSAASDGHERGATFTVLLPTVVESEKATASLAESSTPSRTIRVLVVEDDVDAADSLALVLTMRGHDVVVAHSVADGLAYGRERFDVLVSDIGLPDGSGIDVITTLRQRGDVRGIAISGFGAPDDVQQSLAAGFERHFTKPVHLDRLLDAIESLVR